MTRRGFVLGGAATALAATPSKPNILLILMDDMGWPALSCFGNPYVKTPHLDQLASEGMRFTQAYVTPQCTPTRSTLMTGQYTARNRMWHVIPWYGLPYARVREPEYLENLPREAFTLGKGMQSAGYKTACIGKWHLTANQDGNYGSLKAEASRHYGFDTVSTLSTIPNEFGTGDKGVNRLTDEAIRFIENNRRNPWFCYLPHHTTHNRLAAPEALVEKYRKQGAPAEGYNNATLLAALEHMDSGIGRLLASVDRLGLRDNTAVFFLTDNGGIDEQYVHNPPIPTDGSPIRFPVREQVFRNTPLRDGKGSVYEGGIRVPMIARWPGVMKPKTTCETPVHIADLMPTFFRMAGAAKPEGYVTDGIDIDPLLRGRKVADRALYWYMPFYDLRWRSTPSAIIREGDYKLIEWFGDSVDGSEYRIGHRTDLYDLRRDVGESTNLALKMPGRVETMRKRLHEWIRSCGAEVPGLNPNYDASRCLDEVTRRRV